MLLAEQERTRRSGLRELAGMRAAQARLALQDCHLCEHHCGVDRLAGAMGKCRAGPRARVFSAQTEVSDELDLIPTFAIALSGCDMRCAFCITGAESWDAQAGTSMAIEEIASRAAQSLAVGGKTIMILGGEPTIHLPTALEILAALPPEAIVIWKTNAHGSAEARALLDGLFDIWLADYKFGNDECATRLSRTPDYTRVIRENLRWAHSRVSLIVRHLVMPGHVECCWRPVARWISENLPGAKVNLRTGFWPAWKARTHAELGRTVDANESAQAWAVAREFSLRVIG
jgi:putative pyruvate formate lyase activating enzyme